ncbi:MAG: hypothetical protein E7218_08125 [Anaerofustis stercorihominis]|nr:hypothetical protein [Anaerofustis stercorihominis]
MINLILGPNGSGKTQKLIDMANEELKNTNGLLVYIDRSDNHRREVDVQIRFVNAKEFAIDNLDKLYGFVNGVLNGNYDINRVYIDNSYKISGSKTKEDVAALIASMKAVKANDADIYMTLNTEDVEGLELTDINIINM